MAHCFSVTVEIDGKTKEICTTHVPGNENLARRVQESQRRGTSPPKPSREEIGRATRHFLFEQREEKRRGLEGP
ncbi:hypothetical protein LCGC14_1350070 [marine sediment metagenome]|uniref:Uncharacterized protein n=1 Tax=marine sediment metagenome TaxID=412755 RepID=A0A0F9KB99_9ZZZZ